MNFPIRSYVLLFQNLVSRHGKFLHNYNFLLINSFLLIKDAEMLCPAQSINYGEYRSFKGTIHSIFSLGEGSTVLTEHGFLEKLKCN